MATNLMEKIEVQRTFLEDLMTSDEAHFKRLVGPPFPGRKPPPEFLLWAYLKDKVCQDKPRTLKQLKKRILEECKTIKPQVFNDVTNNFCLPLKCCKDLKEGHLEHML